MNVYSRALTKNGVLLLSGFYTDDIPVIKDEAAKHSLNLKLKLERNNWVGLRFLKMNN